MSSQDAPPSGYVHLILSRQELFYLEIPIVIITTVCLKPRKYLRYLGWCVLGTIGTLAREGSAIELDGEVEDQSIYEYLLPDDAPIFAHAVDLEVIKKRSQFSSTTTTNREDFRNKLMPRDGCCVWTSALAAGMHIIPFSKGDEWLQLIISNRPGYDDDDVESITINDIRNGISGNDNVHNRHFNPREVVVLKTPNAILEMTDVPPRHQRNLLDSGVGYSYPTNSRYTLQWLVAPATPGVLATVPHNIDAAFLDHSLSKPASVLLHYNYGAAAVKQWGKNVDVLTNRPDLPRPTKTQDHTVSIPKRAGTSDSDDSGAWDEDDVILYFWANSRAAQERFAQEEQERIDYLEKWRNAVE